MAKVSSLQKVSNIDQWMDARRFVQNTTDDITSIINGKLLLADNVNVVFVQVAFGSANKTYKVTHNLSRIPVGYLLVKSPIAAQIFDGNNRNDSTVLYLQCSQATTVTVMVF